MKHRILSRRIPNCLRSYKSARPNLRLHSLAQEETQGPLLVMHYFRKISSVWPLRKSKNDVAGAAGQDPDRQELLRQLKAGERVLHKVQHERNKLQDAHAQLGEELKGIRAELSGSVKENQRLRRGIYSKCLSELL